MCSAQFVLQLDCSIVNLALALTGVSFLPSTVMIVFVSSVVAKRVIGRSGATRR